VDQRHLDLHSDLLGGQHIDGVVDQPLAGGLDLEGDPVGVGLDLDGGGAISGRLETSRICCCWLGAPATR
jgi:hypothetical protein